jgi:hypothetical protein
VVSAIMLPVVVVRAYRISSIVHLRKWSR